MADKNDELKELVVRTISADDAARVALIKALRNTNKDNNEWGGFIYQNGNEFYPQPAVTSGDPYQVEMTGEPYAAGDRLAAVYHTHPKGELSTGFSGGDVNAATANKILSYIGIQDNDTMRVFDPAKDVPDRKNQKDRKSPTGSAKGRHVTPLLSSYVDPEQRRQILQAAALRNEK